MGDCWARVCPDFAGQQRQEEKGVAGLSLFFLKKSPTEACPCCRCSFCSDVRFFPPSFFYLKPNPRTERPETKNKGKERGHSDQSKCRNFGLTPATSRFLFLFHLRQKERGKWQTEKKHTNTHAVALFSLLHGFVLCYYFV